MDPIALAQLPLATLALAAIFWVLLQLLNWASARIEDGRARWARRSKFLYHTQFSMAVFAAGIEAIQEQIAQEIGIENGQENTDEADKSLLGTAEAFLGSILSVATTVAPSQSTDSTQTYTVTPGHLDFQDVADNLHRYAPDRAGLILFLIEEMPMIGKMFEEVNDLAGQPSKRLDRVSVLMSLQFILFGACVAAKALLEKEFHAGLKTIVADKQDPTERTVAIVQLMSEHSTFVTNLKAVVQDQEGMFKFMDVDQLVPEQYASYFRARAFDVMTLSTPSNKAWIWAGVPAFAFILFFGLLVFSNDIRTFLYGGPARISCESTYDAAGLLLETKCTHEVDILPGR